MNQKSFFSFLCATSIEVFVIAILCYGCQGAFDRKLKNLPPPIKDEEDIPLADCYMIILDFSRVEYICPACGSRTFWAKENDQTPARLSDASPRQFCAMCRDSHRAAREDARPPAPIIELQTSKLEGERPQPPQQEAAL